MAGFQIDVFIGDGATGVMFEVDDVGGAFEEYDIPPVEMAEAMMAFLRPYLRRAGRYDGCCYVLYDREAVKLNIRFGGRQSYPKSESAFDET